MGAWKLFTVIFFSVFLAIITSHFVMMFLALLGMSSLMQAFGPAFSSQRSVAVMPQPAISVPANIPIQVNPEETKRQIAKQRARENDIRLCKSWRNIYAKEPLETYKMHMETSCKRAYGGQ